MDRDLLQSNTAEQLKLHKRIILGWSTGTGKSRAPILFIHKYKPKRILLLVAERSHKQNWETEFIKTLGNTQGVELYKECTIECYASLPKYHDTEWNLIVADEIHHIFTDKKIDIMKSIKAEYIIGLSATIPYRQLHKLEDIYGEFIIDRIGVQEAIDNNFIREPKFIKVPLELDNKYSTEYLEIKLGKTIFRTIECSFSQRWNYLRNRKAYSGVLLRVKCTPFEKYQHLTKDVEYWYNKHIEDPSNGIYKRMWLLAGSRRKRALGEMKTASLMKLVTRIRNEHKRFICFCTSIEQAELLGGKNAISSKNDRSLSVISKFNNKTINELFAINMAQEGLNLRDIEVDIIGQLDGAERAFIQKVGRGLRAESPIIYILYFENTKDTDYLESSLEGINTDYISELKSIQI